MYCMNQICEWHELEGKKVEAFATILMHQTGPDYWNRICKDCLKAAVEFEIEAIEGQYYDEAKPERIPLERKVIASLE
jgi:hypothetical protein